MKFSNQFYDKGETFDKSNFWTTNHSSQTRIRTVDDLVWKSRIQIERQEPVYVPQIANFVEERFSEWVTPVDAAELQLRQKRNDFNFYNP